MMPTLTTPSTAGPTDRTRLLHRLKRIAGQVAGIQRMVEEGRYCADILTQIAALRSAVGWLVAHGVRLAPGGIRRGAAGHDVCFIHPKPSIWFPISGNGVLIELVQAPPAVVQAFSALLASPG